MKTIVYTVHQVEVQIEETISERGELVPEAGHCECEHLLSDGLTALSLMGTGHNNRALESISRIRKSHLPESYLSCYHPGNHLP